MNLHYSKASLFVVLFACVSVSCQKIESTTIGSGLIPPIDNVNTFDTIVNVISENVFDTSSLFISPVDNHSLGRINNDPVFGNITSIINMEVTPPYYPFYFFGTAATRKFDSVVLVLAYKGMWGDSTKQQKFNVYEISQTDTLKATVAYSTKYEVKHEPALLGTITVDPRYIHKTTADTLNIYGNEVVQDEIRIPITHSAFINRFISLYDSAKNSPNNAFYDDTAFQKNFRGFAIVPDTGFTESNGLFSINIADQDTKLVFYYSAKANDTSSKRDTTATYFTFHSSQATMSQQADGHSNQIIRNYAGAEINKGFLAAGADSLIYIQARPGISARVRIPGLDSVKNRVVHRAELIMEQVPHSDLDKVLSPPLLFLAAFSADSSGNFMLPSSDVEYDNQGVANYSTFGGFPFKKTVNGVDVQVYNFDLTRYVQGIITRKNRNYSLQIFAPFTDAVPTSEFATFVVPISGSGPVNPVAAGRVRLGGGNHSQYKMRLRIIYSRL